MLVGHLCTTECDGRINSWKERGRREIAGLHEGGEKGVRLSQPSLKAMSCHAKNMGGDFML